MPCVYQVEGTQTVDSVLPKPNHNQAVSVRSRLPTVNGEECFRIRQFWDDHKQVVVH